MKNIYWLLILVSILFSNKTYAGEVSSTGELYNQGVDFYKKEDYNKAGESFLKALNTENNRLEQWTNYNLGNSNFKKAQALEAKDQAAALSLYKNALEFFHRAIKANTKDTDAKYNYELTARKIKELEAQQKHKQQQEQSQSSQESLEQKDKESQEKKEQQQKQSQQKEAGDEPKQQEQSSQKQSTAPNQSSEAKPMTKKEAEMLLDNFQRSEKEQKQLFLKQKQYEHSPVDKDW